MPVPPTSRYFQVASNAREVPLKWSSGTAVSVTASVVIQSMPRCLAWCPALRSPRIASSEATNTRLGRSVRILR
jgi:hypothetical protein